MKQATVKSLLVASAAMAISLAARAQEFVIHNGDSYSHQFGSPASSATVVSDTYTTGPSSISMQFGAAWNNLTFNATASIVPSTIDWSTDSLSIDYRTTNLPLIYSIQLWADSQTIVASWVAPAGYALNTDGQWHTLTLTGGSWLPAMDAYNQDDPMTFLIRFQAFDVPGTFNFDNVRIGSPIPEPSSFALLASLGVGFIVASRRRRSQRLG